MASFAGLFICLFIIWNKRVFEHRNNLDQIEKDNQKQLLKASVDGQEAERKRIAEDLHDDIGPLLSALKLQLNSNSNVLDKSEINNTLNLTVKNLRNVSSRMSPAVLEQLGLNKAVAHVIQRLKTFRKWEITFEWDETIQEILSKDQEIHLYRIIQEAINNIVKHSKSTQISLIGNVSNSAVNVTILDNGSGFEQEQILETTGLGLNTMRARAEVINAQIKIKSDDTGTTINLKIETNHDKHSIS